MKRDRYLKTKTGKRYQEKTVNAIFSMLSENTGKALCDSGGAYGRNWEKNQGKTRADWLNSPEVIIDFWERKPGEFIPFYTLNVFHFLADALEIDSICEAFNRVNVKADNWDGEKFYGLSSEGEAFLNNIGAEIGEAWNSYNWSGPYSQVLQGAPVKIGEAEYLLIQIHGGCDVRGGYTTARLFKFPEYSEGFLYPPTIWATINGKEFTNNDGGEGGMVEDDETQKDRGFGGAEAVILSEGEPTVEACGFETF